MTSRLRRALQNYGVVIGLSALVGFVVGFFWGVYALVVLVPSLGLALTLTGVSVAATVITAIVAIVALWDAKRGSREALILKRLEQLYSPLYHIIQESGGRLFATDDTSLQPTSMGRLPTYWNGQIQDLMRKSLYLAKPKLAAVYWDVVRADTLDMAAGADVAKREDHAKQFSEQAKSDYADLLAELRVFQGSD